MKIVFSPPALPDTGVLVVGVMQDRKLTPSAREMDKRMKGGLSRAIKGSRFKGGKDQSLTLLGPAGTKLEVLYVAGLGKAAYAELCGEKGLSEAKACQLLAALELGRRFISLSPEERIIISTSQDAANLVTGEMGTLDQEHLRVILLNTRNEVLSTHEIYVGNVNSSVVRPAEVFRPAVRSNAPSLIVVHNHPSGNPAPSDDDIAITKDLVEAGKLLGMEVLDHLIIGSGQRYVSMNESGQGFN